MNLEVSAYLRRIHGLFHDRKCLSEVGYASYMLELLRTPMVFTVGKDVHSIGNEGGVPQSTIESCISRMQCWTALNRAAVMAEFPHFEVSQVGLSRSMDYTVRV